jgi:hypothetical protein
VSEGLLACDYMILQRCQVKQPIGDFMTVTHTGRIRSRQPDRSASGKSVDDEDPVSTSVDIENEQWGGYCRE